ncbi:MAG: M48 family metallopeptidase [Candidatus Hodarchaeales archaeon]
MVNATVFFVLTLIQMIIVSWISIRQVPPDLPSNTPFPIKAFHILGFYITVNPFDESGNINIRFTVLLILLTAGLQILLLAFLINIVFSNKNMVQIYPEPLYGPAYSSEEAPLVEKTIDLVTRVSQKARIKVTKIFVYRKAVPNAFSLDMFPIPFLRRPYLVLNTNVLEILSDKEIESVIAHELAHVKNGDSLVRLVLSIPRLFLTLSYLFIYLQIVTGILTAIFDTQDFVAAINRAIFFGIVYLFIVVAMRITVHFLYSANRNAEFLADFFAARLFGANVLINSLIHLGQRSEAMQVLSREIEWLESLSGDHKKPTASFMRLVYQRFPKTQLDEDIARKIAPKVFLEAKFDQLTTHYNIKLDEKLKEKLIEDAVPNLLEKRARYYADLSDETKEIKPSTLKEKTIDWRFFDSDSNSILESDEIDSFIETLISQPDKMVFEHELFGGSEQSQDHPSFRSRILTIYRFFNRDKYEEILSRVFTEQYAKPDTSASS